VGSWAKQRAITAVALPTASSSGIGHQMAASRSVCFQPFLICWKKGKVCEHVSFYLYHSRSKCSSRLLHHLFKRVAIRNDVFVPSAAKHQDFFPRLRAGLGLRPSAPSISAGHPSLSSSARSTSLALFLDSHYSVLVRDWLEAPVHQPMARLGISDRSVFAYTRLRCGTAFQ
jgi:hypothetical protein